MYELPTSEMLSVTGVGIVLITTLAVCTWRKCKMKEEQLQFGGSIADEVALKASKRYVPDYMVLEQAPICHCAGGDTQLCGSHTINVDIDPPTNTNAQDGKSQNCSDLYTEVRKPPLSHQLDTPGQHSAHQQGLDPNHAENPTPIIGSNEDDNPENIYANRIHQGPVTDWRSQLEPVISHLASRSQSVGHKSPRTMHGLKPHISLVDTDSSKRVVAGSPTLYSVVEKTKPTFRRSDGMPLVTDPNAVQVSLDTDAVEWEENELYESGPTV